MSIGVTPIRREKVAVIATDALDIMQLSHGATMSLRGKSRWCICPVFGRVGVSVVHALGVHEKSSATDSTISEETAEAIRLLIVVMRRLPNHVVRFRQDRITPATVALTDASFAADHKWLGFLVACPVRGMVWAGMDTPLWLLELFRKHKERRTYIGQLEAVVAAALYCSLPGKWFQGRPVTHYIDNQGALYALINGRSDDVDINRIVFITRMKLLRLECDVWFDYVPSASNVADLPTRLDDDAMRRLHALGRRVDMTLPPQWCLDCPSSQLAVLFD